MRPRILVVVPFVVAVGCNAGEKGSATGSRGAGGASIPDGGADAGPYRDPLTQPFASTSIWALVAPAPGNGATATGLRAGGGADPDGTGLAPLPSVRERLIHHGRLGGT